MDDQRTCKNCNQTLTMINFRPHHHSCRECERERARMWKAANKEHTLQYTRNWKAANKEHVSEYNSKYSVENRNEIQKRSTAYHIMRYHNDVNFKLARKIREKCSRVVKSVRPSEEALRILGCTQQFLKAWLEYNFTPEMNFDNYGKVWHIDHLIPISKFDLTDDNEMRKCFHWTNCQPMLARENQSKNNRVTSEDVLKYEANLTAYIERLPIDQYTLVTIDRLQYIK